MMDLVMAFVSLWWGILKTGVAVVYWIMQKRRERPIDYLAQPAAKAHPLEVRPTGLEEIGDAEIVPVNATEGQERSLLMIGGGLLFLGVILLFMGSADAVFFGVVALIGGVWLALQGFATKPTAYALPANVETEADIEEIPDERVIYTVTLPSATAWNHDQALAFIEQLLSNLPKLTFRIQADQDGIRWQIVDAFHLVMPNVMEELIRASYPRAEVTVTVEDAGEEVEAPFYRYVCQYQQMNMFVAPMLYVTDITTVDPIAALAQAMNQLQPGERVSYVLGVLGPAPVEAYQQAERMITQSTIHPLQLLSNAGIQDALAKKLSGYDRVDKFVARDQRVFDTKLGQRLYTCVLLVQVDSPDQERLTEIMVGLDAQISHFVNMPFNGLVWVERPPDQHSRYIKSVEVEQSSNATTVVRNLQHGQAVRLRPPVLILEPKEIAAAWHLPHANVTAPRVSRAKGTVDIPEPVARLKEGLLLGIGRYQGQDEPILIPQADRTTHLNVIGKTGTGKSTLLHHLIHQDIAAGRGVAVIDPHGSLVDNILRSSIPDERIEDVVVLDLANHDYPPPLNPLVGGKGYTSTLRMIGIIERLFSGTESAARMASYLRAGLIPLQSEPHATMRDVARLFMDPLYREQRLSQTDDPETLDFWDFQFNQGSPALQRQIADPIINRIRPFYANPYLYPILCHPDTLDFRSLIQAKKIILISLALDEELVPDQERNLVGALLMSRLQMSGMKDAVAERFFIYVDEVQRFVTSALDELLSEARKYGLSLTIANQFLGQLTGKTLDAVMGNVGASIIFQCSPDDTGTLAPYVKPEFTAQELLNLDRYHAVVKLQVHGQTQPAFSLRTFLPLDPMTDGREREQSIRRRSAERYTPKRRDEVLAWLHERYPRPSRSAQQPELSEEETFYDE
jgi:hypothetical protein